MRGFWRKLMRVSKEDAVPVGTVFNRYVQSAPSAQNAVDIIPGWSTAFPPQFSVTAGTLPTFADARIQYALDRFGPLNDRVVLELGPLEAGHTAMLEAAGAGQIDAIEANQLAFMRCLVAKEIMQLKHTRFWLGDFVKWLENASESYDLIVASGVLYHMTDPLHLIELIAQRCSAAYIWTHVLDHEAMPPGDPRRMVFSDREEVYDFHGLRVRACRRTYLDSPASDAFCGGMRDDHRWLEKTDLLAALRAVGFTTIETAHEEPDHRFGPALSIFARK